MTYAAVLTDLMLLKNCKIGESKMVRRGDGPVQAIPYDHIAAVRDRRAVAPRTRLSLTGGVNYVHGLQAVSLPVETVTTALRLLFERLADTVCRGEVVCVDLGPCQLLATNRTVSCNINPKVRVCACSGWVGDAATPVANHRPAFVCRPARSPLGHLTSHPSSPQVSPRSRMRSHALPLAISAPCGLRLLCTRVLCCLQWGLHPRLWQSRCDWRHATQGTVGQVH